MATATDTATVTATETIDALTRRNGHSHANGTSTISRSTDQGRTYKQKKYRHVAAVHSKPRTSCLSHDSPTTPSFIGFRNLMVIVLSTSLSLCQKSLAWRRTHEKQSLEIFA
jgi:diacylglycerol O-acyltransferase-1